MCAPGVVTSGVSFHLTVVPLGAFFLSTLASASGTVPLSTVCGSGVGLNFVIIDLTVIVTCVLLLLLALSVTWIVTLYDCSLVPTGNFVTSWTPFLNLIVLVVSSYVKKFGNPVTVVDLTPLPPELSILVTFISGNVLSNAIKSQFCLSLDVWIVGFVTSLTSSGIVTVSVVSSRYVTVALIILLPYSAVLIVPTGVTDFTLLLPLLLIVTAAFRSLFVTEPFWFLTILFPVGAYSSLNLRTLTVTFTVSFELSG